MAVINSTHNVVCEELVIENGITYFNLWAPKAAAVQLSLYNAGSDSIPVARIAMSLGANGLWSVAVPKPLYGMFYTFRIFQGGHWLSETPGINAKAVGLNGQRAAIIDFTATDPTGWSLDRGPRLDAPTDAVIYELHYRDFSAHPASGFRNKGKYLIFTEADPRSDGGDKTGIGHLKELGITHVQLMPSFDFSGVDENTSEYNWGYNPRNYNVPSGLYSTDPSDPYSRVREFKLMVKAFHDAGIGVITDVVYNHTASDVYSNFSLTAPGYYYRMCPDGSFSNASGCGNETASERSHVRDYIIESLNYWVQEYHIDGFRFDLMGIHDIETMSRIRDSLCTLRPDILLYGEGWTAGQSTLASSKRAIKQNISRLPGVGVFSDDLRDAVKGHFASDTDCGFVNGRTDLAEAVKAGIVAATSHPQVDFSKSLKSKTPYALTPTQIINYVSCHDNLTLTDKLRLSVPGASEELLQRMAKLAQTIVFTSQGIPFIFSGEEFFRDKQGQSNTYCSPDSVNAIDWSLKKANTGLFRYYCELIKFRHQHPAFRMTTADSVARHLMFDSVELPKGVIAFSLIDNANGDSSKEIKVILNANRRSVKVNIAKTLWTVIADNGEMNADGLRVSRGGRITVAPLAAMILVRE